jgi:hypothetical protein
MTVGDVNVDGLDDILVMDPACGNWVAVGEPDGGFRSGPWKEILPDLAPQFFLDIVNVAPRRPMVMTATEFWIAAVYRQDDGQWQNWERQYGEGFVPWLSFTHMFGIRNQSFVDVEVLFQRRSILKRFGLDASAGTLHVNQEQDLNEELYGVALRPHDGYDHFVGFTQDACDIVAFGVGLYPKSAGPLPRKIVALRRMADGFVAQELSFDCDTITFGTAARSSDVFVGALGRCGNQTTVQLGRLRDCGQDIEIVARRDVEFDWRTPPAPPYQTDPTLRRTDGIDLFMEALETGGARFTSYDGFTLRTIVAEEGSSWSMREETHQVHAKREDVAW